MSILLRLIAPFRASTITKVPTTPIMTRFYSTVCKDDVIKAKKDTVIKTSNTTVEFMSNTNSILNVKETEILTRSFRVFLPYLQAMENQAFYNKYKWSLYERNSFFSAMKWIGKKPTEIQNQDYIILSFLIKTRSPIQCERFLQYRIKNKMDGFV